MKRQTDDTLTSRVYSYGTVPGRVAPGPFVSGTRARGGLSDKRFPRASSPLPYRCTSGASLHFRALLFSFFRS